MKFKGNLSLRADALEFPVGFHGDRKSTRKVVDEFCRAVWEAGTWQDAVAKLKTVKIDSRKGGIIAVEGRSDRADEDSWRLYWLRTILVDLSAYSKGALDAQAAGRKYGDLLVAGLQWLWAAIGFIDGVHPTCLYKSDDEERDKFWRPALDRYVDWLPEIISLNSRISFGRTASDCDEFYGVSAVINLYEKVFRVELGDHAIFDIKNSYGGDPIHALKELGIADLKDGRFVLLEPKKGVRGKK